jgi:diguanylate cyclase (GGDEF)-like protein
VLNKYAWASQHDPAMRERASELIDEMETLLEDGKIIPPAAMLDTIAWIRLFQGRVDDADRLLGHALSARRTEPNDDAALLAHLATVRHHQGRLDEATRLLEIARVVALRARTPALAVDALRHLATIDADRGDFRRAYRRLSRFVAEQSATERAEAERQATILQSVYGTQAERDQRLYYQELAMRDPLTRLYNRRHVEGELPLLLRDDGVAVAMIDIDHFKEINDKYGHATGDAALRFLALQVGGLLRPHDILARTGGEEFTILLPETTKQNGTIAAERLRYSFEVSNYSHKGVSYRFTLSIGVAELEPECPDFESLWHRADMAMYAAKRLGRNRVCVDGRDVAAASEGTFSIVV